MVKQKKNKKYRPLLTINVIEGLLLLGEVIKKGLVYAKVPKISDEMYIEVVKAEVSGDIK